jgi:hypothetical protein
MINSWVGSFIPGYEVSLLGTKFHTQIKDVNKAEMKNSYRKHFHHSNPAGVYIGCKTRHYGLFDCRIKSYRNEIFELVLFRISYCIVIGSNMVEIRYALVGWWF